MTTTPEGLVTWEETKRKRDFILWLEDATKDVEKDLLRLALQRAIEKRD